MQFQSLLNPFGVALQQMGQTLQNESQAISNATSLYKLGIARENYHQMINDITSAGRSADSVGGLNTQPQSLQAQGSGQQGGTGTGAPLGSSMLFQQVKTFQDSARRYRYIDPSLSERYASKAQEALHQAIEESGKEYTTQDKFLERVHDTMAASAMSPETMGEQIALLSNRVPPGVDLNKLLYSPTDKGGMGLTQGPNGLPMWEPEKLQAAGQLSKAAQEMRRMKHEEMMAQYRQSQEDRADARYENTLKEQDRRDARAREAEDRRSKLERNGRPKPGYTWVDPDDPSKGQKQIPIIGDQKVTDNAQKDLEKDPLWKNYDKYQQARGAVSVIEKKMATNPLSVTAADVQELRAKYANIIQDFRTRAGGVKDLKEFDRLNGVIQSLDKWIDSIGRGTPAVSSSTAKTAMEVVNREYSQRTKDLAVNELRTAARVEKRGGKADQLMLHADIPYLISSGQASLGLDDDGTKKIRIKTPEGDKVFDYPEGAYQ